jgi:hypothetical protein
MKDIESLYSKYHSAHKAIKYYDVGKQSIGNFQIGQNPKIIPPSNAN